MSQCRKSSYMYIHAPDSGNISKLAGLFLTYFDNGIWSTYEKMVGYITPKYAATHGFPTLEPKGKKTLTMTRRAMSSFTSHRNSTTARNTRCGFSFTSSRTSMSGMKGALLLLR